LEIADSFIAWSTKTIDQKEYQSIRRCVLPDTAFWSSFAAARYQFDIQANRIRDWFGYQPKFNDDVVRMQARIERATRANAGGTTTSPNSNVPAQPADQTSKTSEKRDASANPEPTQKTDPSNPTSANQKKVGMPKLPSLTPPGEQSKPITLMLFLQNMAKNSKPFQIDPPRGTIIVQGLIEVVGSRGRTTVEASAAYDPRANDFVVSSWNPRRFQPKSQTPRGGR
jgi:hypothetical protein